MTLLRIAVGLGAGLTALTAVPARPGQDSWQLNSLAPIARVDPRFQSYNIEMVEVTGGRFWAPYGGPPDEVYRMRAPINLASPRLRRIARLLAPAYLRVSGTWANNTYVPAHGEKISTAPAGFKQVLQREQWRGLVAFSRAVDAPIVTSFAVSGGTRDASGLWQPHQAQRLLDLTREAGGRLYAAEFFNEPNLPTLADVPAGYNVAAYARDFSAFHTWARRAAPAMKIIGPGSVGGAAAQGEVPANALGSLDSNASEAMMIATKDRVDAVSYHFYGTVSQRCAFLKIGTAQKDQALSPAWLDRTLTDQAYFARLRDAHEPNKPLWLTETAQAACGGSPWASSFLDTFRYLNQLGVLAQRNVQVVMHNTLAASDYALLEPDSFDPRPSFWAAVLWHRTMGEVVLAPPKDLPEGARVFAHCLRGQSGGVALLVLNPGAKPIRLPDGGSGLAWMLEASPIDSKTVRINGTVPTIDRHGLPHGLAPMKLGGSLTVPAYGIAFAAIPKAGNPACR